MVNTVQNQVNTFVSQPQGGDKMDKEAFLELMIAQLQNQNPLEPMDGTEYASQLAQFSSLEQLSNLNESMNRSIDADYFLTQSINNTLTATLIGNDVKLASPILNNIGQESIKFGYKLPADASEVTIQIYNESGLLVRTISQENTPNGDHKLSWDFSDDNGKKLPEGSYRFEIEAKNAKGENMLVETYGIGRIDGVRFGENGTTLIVGGIEYSLADIIEILNPSSGENENNGSSGNSGSSGNDGDSGSDGNNGNSGSNGGIGDKGYNGNSGKWNF
ncbi:MAG: flagellar hook capping protein [Melioribacteraceae bacterium]|nr:flagellar hook capping protein [Melioribacteraceae bacterium]